MWTENLRPEPSQGFGRCRFGVLMPTMPRTFRAPGMPTRTEQKRAHDTLRRRDNPARAWYQTKAWRDLRKGQLEREPNCRKCHEHGKLVKATVCDHVIPHRGDEAAFWHGPFQSLCKPCHDGWKQVQERRSPRGRAAQ